VKPILQALLLADRIYQDAATRKYVIAGTFNNVFFKRDGAKPQKVMQGDQTKVIVPGGVQAGSPSAYISLTEIRGAVDCILRFVFLASDEAVFQCRFQIECNDPLQTVELTLPLPSLPHKEGVYALELLCNDEPIGAHRVTIEEMPPKGEGKGNDDHDDR
jgi:hypothetical protein